MVNWLIIVVLILVLLWFFKVKHMKHKFYAIIVVVLLIFFYTTFSSVINDNQIDVKSFDGVISAGKLYFSWLGNAIKNMAVIGGDVVKMDWAGNTTGG